MSDKPITSSLLRQEGPQQESKHAPNCNAELFNGPMGECDCGVHLLARLRDYHDQVLQGFRHISRKEEADLIQAAIDGLRQKEQK